MVELVVGWLRKERKERGEVVDVVAGEEVERCIVAVLFGKLTVPC